MGSRSRRNRKQRSLREAEQRRLRDVDGKRDDDNADRSVDKPGQPRIANADIGDGSGGGGVGNGSVRDAGGRDGDDHASEHSGNGQDLQLQHHRLTLVGIPASRVDKVWPLVKDWLAAALEHGPGLYDISHVKQWCIDREMQLWIAWDADAEKIVAAAVTQIIKYPLKTALTILLIGGTRLKDWWWMHKTIGEGAKALHGCVEMHGYARDGWLKPCLADGWLKSYTFITRPL